MTYIGDFLPSVLGLSDKGRKWTSKTTGISLVVHPIERLLPVFTNLLPKVLR